MTKRTAAEHVSHAADWHSLKATTIGTGKKLNDGTDACLVNGNVLVAHVAATAPTSHNRVAGMQAQSNCTSTSERRLQLHLESIVNVANQ